MKLVNGSFVTENKAEIGRWNSWLCSLVYVWWWCLLLKTNGCEHKSSIADLTGCCQFFVMTGLLFSKSTWKSLDDKYNLSSAASVILNS